MESSNQSITSDEVPKNCPHCGHELTLWEQVLLSVDRMLVCRHCWYRIIVGIGKSEQNQTDTRKED